MATEKVDLHTALANLSPLEETSLPDQPSLEPFLESTFSNAAYIIDTLPIPPPSSSTQQNSGRSRSTTVSSATSVSSNSSSKLTILPSAVRPPPPPNPSVYTKDWKEVKPGGANPHDIKVYKLSSKDGNGAWFARRSVHEGIGFARFRKGLRREFEESLNRKMGVGRSDVEVGENGEWEGMVIPAGVRGIGAERRLDRRVVKGLGRIDVYHLSAQFPGPSAPRDFVTACITSSVEAPSHTSVVTPSGRKGREFTMVSRPLTHNAAPEQGGFVRGRYESIEFIREIIPEEEDLTSPRRSMSVSDLTQRSSILASIEGEKKIGRPRSRTVGETPRKVVSFDGDPPSMRKTNTGLGVDSLREHKNSRLREAISADDIPDEEVTAPDASISTLQAPQPNDEDADSFENEEDGETNPVEWIMLTRSDPGGSVPRFMVERGTPGSIVKDAEKFLDWACEKVHVEDISDDENDGGDMIDDDHLGAGVSSQRLSSTSTVGESPESADLRRAMSNDDSMSNLSFMTASSGEGEFEEWDGHSPSSSHINGMTSSGITPSIAVSEELNGRPRSESSLALQKIQTDAIKSAERAKTNREKDDKKIARELAKEAEKQRKLEEKHAKEAQRREERFKREQQKAEEKRRKEEEKIRDRRRKLEERDEKVRNEREKEDLRREIELLRKEKDVLVKENETLRNEVGAFRARYELENGGIKTPPSRSSSQVMLSLPQRPQSPASSSSSKGNRKP